MSEAGDRAAPAGEVVPRIVLVTDPRYSAEDTARVIRAAAAALGRAGVLLVQLRDKQASVPALLATARALRAVTREAGARLLVNGPLDVACAVDADGLHFPNQGSGTVAHVLEARAALGDGAFITTTAHDDEDVGHAARAGASAILVSPIYGSPGKAAPRGVVALAAARAIVDAARHVPPLPSRRTLVYALGGIDRINAASCAAAGADGVAAIRALYEGQDASALAAPFLAASAAARQGPPR